MIEDLSCLCLVDRSDFAPIALAAVVGSCRKLTHYTCVTPDKVKRGSTVLQVLPEIEQQHFLT